MPQSLCFAFYILIQLPVNKASGLNVSFNYSQPLSFTGVKYVRRVSIFEWMIQGNNYTHKNFNEMVTQKKKEFNFNLRIFT